MYKASVIHRITTRHLLGYELTRDSYVADKREFIKISQAVGVGFVVMGAIGYVVKLSEYALRYTPNRCSKTILLYMMQLVADFHDYLVRFPMLTPIAI